MKLKNIFCMGIVLSSILIAPVSSALRIRNVGVQSVDIIYHLKGKPPTHICLPLNESTNAINPRVQTFTIKDYTSRDCTGDAIQNRTIPLSGLKEHQYYKYFGNGVFRELYEGPRDKEADVLHFD